MNLADVFSILFIILGFLIVFIAYWLLAAGLFPKFTERCSERLSRMPVRTTLLGAVTLAPLVVLGLSISSKAPNGLGKMLGLGLALFSALGALLGSAGLAARVGQGLPSATDADAPWRRVLRGGVVLGLSFVMPFLGTFVILPLTLFGGFGAFLLCLRRKPATAEEPIPAVVAEPPALPTAP